MRCALVSKFQGFNISVSIHDACFMRCALVSRFQGFNISVASCDACFMRRALVSRFHRFAVSRDGIMLCTPTAQCCFEMLTLFG